MKLTVPQFRALEAVQKGRVLRSVMGDEFIAPGMRSQAVWVLFVQRLIADGPKIGELKRMVLTDSGKRLLERIEQGAQPEAASPSVLEDD